MRILDGNSPAELDNDLQQTRADRVYAAYESDARNDVCERWWKNLTIEGVAEALYGLNSSDEAEFLKVCRHSHADAGSIVTTAVERAADAYLETERGQQEIADRVYQLDQEEHDQ